MFVWLTWVTVVPGLVRLSLSLWSVSRFPISADFYLRFLSWLDQLFTNHNSQIVFQLSTASSELASWCWLSGEYSGDSHICGLGDSMTDTILILLKCFLYFLRSSTVCGWRVELIDDSATIRLRNLALSARPSPPHFPQDYRWDALVRSRVQ